MVSVKQASKLLECSEQYIRSACERNILGDCYTNGKKRKCYKVYPGKLADALGITADELLERLRK